MSNGIGTNLVYCTYLGKPHWLIKQNVEEIALDSVGQKHRVYIESIKDKDSVKKIFENAFGEYTETLTNNQLSICKKYLGFNDVKNQAEMHNLLAKL